MTSSIHSKLSPLLVSCEYRFVPANLALGPHPAYVAHRQTQPPSLSSATRGSKMMIDDYIDDGYTVRKTWEDSNLDDGRGRAKKWPQNIAELFSGWYTRVDGRICSDMFQQVSPSAGQCCPVRCQTLCWMRHLHQAMMSKGCVFWVGKFQKQTLNSPLVCTLEELQLLDTNFNWIAQLSGGQNPYVILF